MRGVAVLLAVLHNGALVRAAAVPVGGGVRVPCLAPEVAVAGGLGGLGGGDLNGVGGGLALVPDGQGLALRGLAGVEAADHIRRDRKGLPLPVGIERLNSKSGHVQRLAHRVIRLVPRAADLDGVDRGAGDAPKDLLGRSRAVHPAVSAVQGGGRRVSACTGPRVPGEGVARPLMHAGLFLPGVNQAGDRFRNGDGGEGGVGRCTVAGDGQGSGV